MRGPQRPPMLHAVLAATLIGLASLGARPEVGDATVHTGQWINTHNEQGGVRWKLSDDCWWAHTQVGGGDPDNPNPGISNTIDAKFPLDLDPVRVYGVSYRFVYEAKPVDVNIPLGYPILGLANFKVTLPGVPDGDGPFLYLFHTTDGETLTTPEIEVPGTFTGAVLNQSGFTISCNAGQAIDAPGYCNIQIEVVITER